MQDYSNSIANALELLQTCPKSSFSQSVTMFLFWLLLTSPLELPAAKCRYCHRPWFFPQVTPCGETQCLAVPLQYLFLNRTALALFLSSFFQHYFPLFAPLFWRHKVATICLRNLATIRTDKDTDTHFGDDRIYCHCHLPVHKIRANHMNHINFCGLHTLFFLLNFVRMAVVIVTLRPVAVNVQY